VTPIAQLYRLDSIVLLCPESKSRFSSPILGDQMIAIELRGEIGTIDFQHVSSRLQPEGDVTSFLSSKTWPSFLPHGIFLKVHVSHETGFAGLFPGGPPIEARWTQAAPCLPCNEVSLSPTRPRSDIADTTLRSQPSAG